MIITIDQILDWGPCEQYDTAEKIIAETDDVWPKTPLEIADLNIPIEDRLWVLLRPEIIPEKKLHLLACDFAERVLPIFEDAYPDDKRPRQAIEAKRKWVRGEITDEELAAARDAARAARAAWAAAWAAARAAWAAARAAWDAAWAAARAAWAAARAAWDAAWAAWDAELEWQLKRVIGVLKESGE